MPDDFTKDDNEPASSDKFRSYDIFTGKFEDEVLPVENAESQEVAEGPATGRAMASSDKPKSPAGAEGPATGRAMASPERANPPARRTSASTGLSKPEEAGSAISKPAESGSIAPRPSASKPAVQGRAPSKPAVPRPSASTPAAPRPSASPPAAPRPSASKPAAPGASPSKPSAPRPSSSRPAAPRSASSRPVSSRPAASGNRALETDKHRNAIDAEYTEAGAFPSDSSKDILRLDSSGDDQSGTQKTRKADEDSELDTGPDDFEVKFDFEGKYMDVPEERPLRWRRERRTGCVGGILYAAFVICISILLASLVWLAASDVLGFGAADEEVNMTIPKDFTLEDVVDLLYDAGLIRYKFLFRIYAGYSSADEKITAGAYVLNRNFDYRALVNGMTTRGGARVEVTVQIPEGYTLLQMFALLEEKQVCSADELWRSATWYNYTQRILPPVLRGNKLRLEGYLFPDTYNFYVGSTPEQAISKMLNEFNNKFTEQFAERAEFMGYSIHEIITIASMIEREAGNDEERPYIASVIYNRLNSKDFPMLQIDATIYYALAGTGKPFSTDLDSPYNTYTHEGLPPGPIANPGLASIRAALYPATSKNYYYALNKSGSHNFFDTYEKQRAFVQSDDYGGR